MYQDQGMANMANWSIAEGMTVYASDGEKLGTIRDYTPDASFLDVRKGWIFPKDFFVPVKSVAHVDDDGIVLALTKNELTDTQYDEAPPTLSDFGKRDQDVDVAATHKDVVTKPDQVGDAMHREGVTVDGAADRDQTAAGRAPVEDTRNTWDQSTK